MKKFLFFSLIALMSLSGFSQKLPIPADPKATRETIALFQSIWKLQQKGIMYGHQDDLMYGHTWWYEKDRSDTKDFTGDYPAIAGFELGHLELGNERSSIRSVLYKLPNKLKRITNVAELSQSLGTSTTR